LDLDNFMAAIGIPAGRGSLRRLICTRSRGAGGIQESRKPVALLRTALLFRFPFWQRLPAALSATGSASVPFTGFTDGGTLRPGELMRRGLMQ
jgi:hypothetical protein